MKRAIEKELLEWKKSFPRYPLLLRGARQVGKTYVVEELGKTFEFFEIINLEAQPEAIGCFENLDPFLILQKLELLTKRAIYPGRTLLFIDEIQNSSQAILSLRYFKEKIPNLHVIAAGSLLDFALESGTFSFPVGRVQFIYLKPFSFEEFALALNEEQALLALNHSSIQKPIPEELHQKCLQKIKEYFLIGGMPASVAEFQSNRSFLIPERILELLLATYRADFSKYATDAEQKYLRLIFEGVVYQIGEKFKYSSIDPHMKSRELKIALDKLQMAGLIYLIFATSASGIPIAQHIKLNKFKPLFLDIGLLQRSLQVDPQLVLTQELIHIHRGALAEQFVGQEILAYASFFREEKLFYWEREKISSSAEVDYIITLKQHIIPIEVKAGSQGRLKSLIQFMNEKKSPLGIRISEAPLSFQNSILSIPFYMIRQIPRIIEEILGD